MPTASIFLSGVFATKTWTCLHACCKFKLWFPSFQQAVMSAYDFFPLQRWEHAHHIPSPPPQGFECHRSIALLVPKTQ